MDLRHKNPLEAFTAKQSLQSCLFSLLIDHLIVCFCHIKVNSPVIQMSLFWPVDPGKHCVFSYCFLLFTPAVTLVWSISEPFQLEGQAVVTKQRVYGVVKLLQPTSSSATALCSIRKTALDELWRSFVMVYISKSWYKTPTVSRRLKTQKPYRSLAKVVSYCHQCWDDETVCLFVFT